MFIYLYIVTNTVHGNYYNYYLPMENNLLFKKVLENFAIEINERYDYLRESIFTKETVAYYLSLLCDNTLDVSRSADKELWGREWIRFLNQVLSSILRIDYYILIHYLVSTNNNINIILLFLCKYRQDKTMFKSCLLNNIMNLIYYLAGDTDE